MNWNRFLRLSPNNEKSSCRSPTRICRRGNTPKRPDPEIEADGGGGNLACGPLANCLEAQSRHEWRDEARVHRYPQQGNIACLACWLCSIVGLNHIRTVSMTDLASLIRRQTSTLASKQAHVTRRRRRRCGGARPAATNLPGVASMA